MKGKSTADDPNPRDVSSKKYDFNCLTFVPGRSARGSLRGLNKVTQKQNINKTVRYVQTKKRPASDFYKIYFEVLRTYICTYLLDVVVGESAAVLQLLVGQHQTHLARRDP